MAAKKLKPKSVANVMSAPPAAPALSALDMALAYTFVNEGGFSNNSHDHGGATSQYGVTISELAKWRRHPVSVADVRNMTASEAKDIYKAWYWDALALDKVVHTGVQMAIFDIAIVRGVGCPPGYIQRICVAHGAHIAIDNHIGPQTLAALNSLDPIAFIRDFSAMAEAGFRSIATHPGQSVFLKGWVNRARRLLTLVNVKDIVGASTIVALHEAERTNIAALVRAPEELSAVA